MKKVKLFFTAMMVLLASSAAMAQDVTVTGVVRDASTGERSRAPSPEEVRMQMVIIRFSSLMTPC